MNKRSNISDSELDRLFRNAAESRVIIFEETAWVSIQKILDGLFKNKQF